MSDNFEYELLVFIGRFQPFHVAHQRNVEIALQKARHVLILVGSAGKARTVRNPWTFEERRDMIISCNQTNRDRLSIKPLYDMTYNDTAWIRQVQDAVATITPMWPEPRVGLIGANKDNSSYYLNLFPGWGSVDTGFVKQLHATGVRRMFFEKEFQAHELDTNVLPRPVVHYLYLFKDTPAYEQIKRECEFIADYKKQWAGSPYPPIFSTVDAVVEQSGHVLLVRRRAEPGKGLFALPGGFVNQDETLKDACIRELREETGIKVPESVLRGSIQKHGIFDDPFRSERGRTITTAFHYKLKDGPLPKVKGLDDADKAFWLPISELEEAKMFEDHYHICNKMLEIA